MCKIMYLLPTEPMREQIVKKQCNKICIVMPILRVYDIYYVNTNYVANHHVQYSY